MNSLYLIMTESCQMNCPFCYTKFCTGFENDDSILDPDIAVKVIKKGFTRDNKTFEPFDHIIFHGGEPLLYPDNISYIIDKVVQFNPKIDFGIQTNLAYKELSKKQIQLLIRLGGYGTSYSYDRFAGQEDIERMVINNIKYLATLGVYGTLLITITEDHINNQSPQHLAQYIKEKYGDIKYVKLERAIYPINDILKDPAKYTRIYERIDEYLKQCLFEFPRELSDLYDNILHSIQNNTKWYPTKCSMFTASLYKDQVKYGCPSREIDDNYKDIEKIQSMCLNCNYFKWCGGDCECMNGVCTFPKKSFDMIYSLEELEKRNKENAKRQDIPRSNTI